MVFDVFIIVLVFVGLFMVALKLGQILKPGSEPVISSCALEDGELNEDGACAKCEIKDLVNCPEDNKPKVRKAIAER